MIAGLVWSCLACCALGNSDRAGAATAQDSSSLDLRVNEFINLQFTHGVPYAEAHGFGPEALPILRRLLEDTEYRDRWVWIITTIAFIGAPEGVPILRSFLLDRFHGEVDLHTFQALMATPSVMGTIHSPVVTEFLVSRVNPNTWKDVGWSYGSHRGEDLRILLSKVAINGLSHTGSARARIVLAQLKKKPYSQKQVSNIEQGIRVNEEIAAKGLMGVNRGNR